MMSFKDENPNQNWSDVKIKTEKDEDQSMHILGTIVPPKSDEIFQEIRCSISYNAEPRIVRPLVSETEVSDIPMKIEPDNDNIQFVNTELSNKEVINTETIISNAGEMFQETRCSESYNTEQKDFSALVPKTEVPDIPIKSEPDEDDMHVVVREISIKEENTDQIDVAETEIERQSPASHEVPPKVKKFTCDLCNYQTDSKSCFVRHDLVHDDSKMFKCKECGFQCKRTYHLREHQMLHKDLSQIQMFKCDECSFESRHKGSVRKHKLVHTDASLVERYKCIKCEYVTKYKSAIKQHSLVHKDLLQVQSFECNECGYQCKRKSSLQKHMLLHKDPAQVEMFCCDQCSYRCRQKGNLQRHLLLHKASSDVEMFRCETCSYQSKHKSYLQRHLLVHKDPMISRKFVCDECGYRCKRRKQLQLHQDLHTKLRLLDSKDKEAVKVEKTEVGKG